tara:strand:+ start:102 stop:533 length:432 start_codon:yes stop_codon:yes gene_type:complete
MTNNNLEHKQEFDFNRVNWDISEFSPKDFFSMQVIINAYCYQLERNNVGSVYHNSAGYCDFNIEETGHTKDTGYLWIALESGITIASNGNKVKYVATNWLTNEEFFFDDYDKAIETKLNIKKWTSNSFPSRLEKHYDNQRVVR